MGGPSTLTSSLGTFLASPADYRLREGGPADERQEHRVGPIRRGPDDLGDDPPVRRGRDAPRRDRVGPDARPGRCHRRRLGPVGGAREIPPTRCEPAVEHRRLRPRRDRPASHPRQRRARMGRQRPSYKPLRGRLHTVLHLPDRRYRVDRALCRAREHHHRLLGDHRTRPRQRRGVPHRALLSRSGREAGMHRPPPRRRLRDQRRKGSLGVERDHRRRGCPFLLDRRRRRVRQGGRLCRTPRPGRRLAGSATRQIGPTRPPPG